jgi:hypothetical protein
MGQSIPPMPPRRPQQQKAFSIASHLGTTTDDIYSRMTLDDLAAWATYYAEPMDAPDGSQHDWSAE